MMRAFLPPEETTATQEDLPLCPGDDSTRPPVFAASRKILQRLANRGVSPEVPIIKEVYGSCDDVARDRFRKVISRLVATGQVTQEKPREPGESQWVYRITEQGRDALTRHLDSGEPLVTR